MKPEPDSQLALKPEEPSVMQLLAGVIQPTDGRITMESANVAEKLMALWERTQDRMAKQQFSEALAIVQAATPAVIAQKTVKKTSGELLYTYAPFEEIMRKVQPVLAAHGFTVRFDQELADTTITAICRLTHSSGHTEENRFAVRRGKGPPNASEAQSDGSNSTYAKRFALCNALNIVIEKDDDARNHGEGGFITAKEAADFRERLEACEADIPKFLKFLKFADVQTLEEIPSNKRAFIEELVANKEADYRG